MVIDGGEEFDLSGTFLATRLGDGRSVVVSRYGNPGMMLFDRQGQPVRLLARAGSGPGELQAPGNAVLLPGDTLLVVDASNATINRYTADSGFIRSERRLGNFSLECYPPGGRLANGDIVATGICGVNRGLAQGILKPSTQLVTMGPDFAELDTVAMVPGSRMAMVEVTQNGRTFPSMKWIQFGQPTSVTAVDSTIVVGSGDGGYVLDLRSATGTPVGRIVVDRAPVLVTEAMREAQIERSVKRQMVGSDGVTRTQAMKVAEQEPIADTVAAYQWVTATPSGTIWVLDFILPDDSTWSATAFRRDGAILGRVTGPRHGGMPVWFGDDRVMIREVDADGVVRYAVLHVSAGDK